jgi:ATP-dependent Clp protease adaptor protein ClpS
MKSMASLLETIEEVETGHDPDSSLEPNYHVVLLNDDHHTDAYVVEMLGRLFCIPPSQAFRHAVEVDTTGRTIVLTCERPQAEFARDQIHAYGPDPRLKFCQGSMSAVVEPAGEKR